MSEAADFNQLPRTTVLLFDVDGVLVNPLAYKEGIKKSIEFLCNEIHLANTNDLIPDDSDIAFMESRGIHDVWDMTNIIFALILHNLFRSAPAGFEPGSAGVSPASTSTISADALMKDLSSHKVSVEHPDYKSFAKTITNKDHSHPPDITLAILTDNNISEQETTLLNAFLKSTRSATESYGTRIFQNIILGSTEFESTYNLPSQYTGPSLLKSIDEVLLSKASLTKLTELRERPDFKMAVYTARPSLAPPDIAPVPGFSPEAEIAAEAAGLASLPLVGMGMMEWLASMHNERTEDLTKPNMTHSLSALLAAILENNSSKTLELAYAFERAKSATELSPLKNQHLEIIVFEDTSSGIKPLKLLAKSLNQKGYSISVTSFGIANQPAKQAALQEICEQVFPDINEAISFTYVAHLES